MGAPPIRVAHVISALNFGGVENMVLQLLRRLPADRFHQSVVVVGDQMLRLNEFSSHAEVLQCPLVRGRRWRFVRAFQALMAAQRPDVVLAHNFGNHAWVALSAWCAGLRGILVVVAGSPLRRWISRGKCFVLAHLARPFCRGEIAVSRQVARELIGGLLLPRRRVRIIPNGCDVREIRRRAERRRRAREASSTARIIMVARMDDAKDQDRLIRCLPRVRRSHPAARLWLVGDGPRRSGLADLAHSLGLSEAIEFLGDRQDVAELLGSCDVFAFATHTEGFALALIEAMAAGTPIVAADIPSCREVLAGGRFGLLVPGGAPELFAQAVDQLLSDPTRRRHLAARAFRHVWRRYDIARTASAYGRLIEENARPRRWE